MSLIEQSIEVDVPANTAYNQWTQFEEFPKFMEGVKAVQQLDAKRLHWRAEIAGKEKNGMRKLRSRFPINALPGGAGAERRMVGW